MKFVTLTWVSGLATSITCVLHEQQLVLLMNSLEVEMGMSCCNVSDSMMMIIIILIINKGDLFYFKIQ